MRVAFVSIDDFRGPTSKQVHHFAVELAGRAHDSLILVRGDPASFEELGRPASPRVHIAAYAFRGPRLTRATRAAVDSFAPEILHCYEPRVASYLAARELAESHGVPLCVHFADDDRLLFREAGGTRARRLARTPLRIAARVQPPLWPFWDPRLDEDLRTRAAALDSLTPALARLVEGRYGRPCRVVLPPVRAPQPRTSTESEELLAALGIAGHPYVLYAGAVFRAHAADFRLLVDAFRLVADRWPDIHLMHVGHVSPRLDVRALGEASGHPARVRFLGYLPRQEDVLELMRRATVLVQPGAPSDFNRYRLPSKLPDYLLSGSPVVTFATGIGELLRDGEEALLTRTRRPEELAERIGDLLADPELRRRVGDAGRRRARELFDPGRSVDALLELYGDVLGRGWRRSAA